MVHCVSYLDWSEPVRFLRERTGPATAEVLNVATLLGCPHNGEPHGVMCAIVEEWLRPVLYGNSSPPATEKQLAYLVSLGHPKVESVIPRPVASAWIEYYQSIHSANALTHLKLASGDRVRFKGDHVEPSAGEVSGIGRGYTVSSIGESGLVYFRGGNGKCAWPSRLCRVSE